MNTTPKTAVISLGLNTVYSTYYVLFGAITKSWWLLTLGCYYVVLSAVRFAVIRTKKHEKGLARFTGWMLMVLSLPLVGVVILSVVRHRGREFHEIAMITIAVYAFTKITLAIVKLIKLRHSQSQRMITLRNISLADAFVSIFSLQRSMLVSFEGMTDGEMRLMNGGFGGAVCVVVFLLGLNLVRKNKVLFKALNT